MLTPDNGLVIEVWSPSQQRFTIKNLWHKSMAIPKNRRGHQSNDTSVLQLSEDAGALEDIPFVPAFDLLPAQGTEVATSASDALSPEEAAVLGATLWEVATTDHIAKPLASHWLIAARINGVSQRL